jgi:hypothetical protein
MVFFVAMLYLSITVVIFIMDFCSKLYCIPFILLFLYSFHDAIFHIRAKIVEYDEAHIYVKKDKNSDVIYDIKNLLKNEHLFLMYYKLYINNNHIVDVVYYIHHSKFPFFKGTEDIEKYAENAKIKNITYFRN